MAAPKKMSNVGIVWLILGPLMIVIFNLLLPQVGLQPVDPQNAPAYLGELAANGDSIRIYSVLVFIGFILYIFVFFKYYSVFLAYISYR